MAKNSGGDAGVRLFRRARSVLIESLYWDAAAHNGAGAMRWTDITLGALHTGALDGADDGADDTVWRVEPPLASFHPASDGGFVAGLGDRVVTLDSEGGITATLAQIDHGPGDLRLNEGKCDPFGAFVVGSMVLSDPEPDDPGADGAIYRIHPDGRTDILIGGLGVANGFEWSDDGREFYFTDTAVQTVYRAAYDPHGELSDVRPYLTGHSSDGLARDTSGDFWNGVYGDGCVLHWSAEGSVLETIDIPAPNVTSVAFGGPDLDTLFVGTARENLTEEQLERWPLSGSIFAFEPGATGHPVEVFGTARLTN